MKTLLTFDYEVFFGENHSNENDVLFEPTKKLLTIANKHDVKLVFFIDICSLFAYEKYHQYEYVERFIRQVEEIRNFGHDIQMHFHPHWLDSIYDGVENMWLHDYKNWSYSDLVDNCDQVKADAIFDLAQNKFIEIVRKEPVAFRSGGYTIQPNEKELINTLQSHGYKCDSSVFPLRRFVSNAQYFDYINCPNLNYWRTDTTSFLNVGESGLVEVPIFALERNILLSFKYYSLKIINKFCKSKSFSKRGKGATLQPESYQSDSFSFSFDMAEMKDKKLIKLLVSDYINKYRNDDQLILNVLSHPKAMFDESLDVFEWFILYMKKKYNCHFVGFDDLEVY
ncbi:hypothetical protein H2O73_10615 [Vibrio sp. 404]|uniref:NodB homology domain-containing protein n=1 Tax=Vibrio marinisediminis TaxID=2758441 RepID=A0A7W2FRD8_9VIBR|nr:hypothetical protein [Vibrio marinisediminis]MBA5762797.1 hypothetical protein [Vibrio marinisediminis]